MTTPAPDLDQEAVGQLLLLTLNSVVGVYEQAKVDLPKRQYVWFGQVAADCEQLTVSLAQLYPGNPGSDPSQVERCNGPRTAVVLVQLFRNVPTASGPRNQGAPAPEDLTSSALAVCRDAYLMLDAAHQVDQSGWRTGVIAEVTPIDASGGMVGISMSLTIGVP